MLDYRWVVLIYFSPLQALAKNRNQLFNLNYWRLVTYNSFCILLTAGWGTLSSGGSSPRVLMQASVPLVSKTRCLRGYPRQIHDSMLCAGYDQGGVDSCQGDSGGPLVCEFGGKWYLEGATSWGHGCAARGKYGVYANIRYLRSWVRGKIGR